MSERGGIKSGDMLCDISNISVGMYCTERILHSLKLFVVLDTKSNFPF
jgi:hypothetical protein